ncbi:MAG: radical SAM protein [Bacteroidetes bacterium]|jgi:wyosine [tRNA(Phe)-imidazoG37] synthetase (radical SAM superfamily)|nr:radical SAM protein [Bacteroidota bacterium]MBT6687465.1 radical SAM protein [Bacteroidota bacterium]MBT7142651.1 radical SAM protein [Bacteroidota bacterium]MBT7493060.1 radical SAM protein [Bacteroidota bacterium]
MATFLFDKTVFGPVISRRLGVSLGINLLPNDSKFCNYNCIYCECGWTNSQDKFKKNLPSREKVKLELSKKLADMKQNQNNLDVITFAGNGEPTIHPDFAEIIDDTIEERNQHFPNARIAVLSNATMIKNQKVYDALHKVDDNILKIDSAFQETNLLFNNPLRKFDLKNHISNLKTFKKNLTIQTMFLHGTYENRIVDNTTEKEIAAWIDIIKDIKPKRVMIYTIHRDTPSSGLEKVPIEKLNQIAEMVRLLNIEVQVSG